MMSSMRRHVWITKNQLRKNSLQCIGFLGVSTPHSSCGSRRKTIDEDKNWKKKIDYREWHVHSLRRNSIRNKSQFCLPRQYFSAISTFNHMADFVLQSFAFSFASHSFSAKRFHSDSLQQCDEVFKLKITRRKNFAQTTFSRSRASMCVRKFANRERMRACRKQGKFLRSLRANVSAIVPCCTTQLCCAIYF